MYYKNDRKLKQATSAGMTYWNVYKAISDQQNTLIAGCPGSGKSTVLQGVLYTICNNYTPCKAELWLADPKRVDLIEWLDRETPHVQRYANTTGEIKQMLADLVDVMESRYRWMEQNRLKQYPGRTIWLVVDELGDLLITDYDKTVLRNMIRLMQLARAASIRVITCTQSPSRITIPARLAVNYTAKLALRCATAIESRQVLGVAGAENLPRYGKGIFLSPDYGMVPVDLPMQDHDDIVEMTRRSVEWAIYK